MRSKRTTRMPARQQGDSPHPDSDSTSSPPTGPGTRPPAQADNLDSLVSEFSRFHPVEGEKAQTRDIKPMPPGDESDDMEAGDQINSGSENMEDSGVAPDGNNGDPSDHQRWDVVDRIMKSFCTALDSKIAAIKGTKVQTAIKKEVKVEPETTQVDVPTISGDGIRRRGMGYGVPSAHPPGAPISASPDAGGLARYRGLARLTPAPAAASVPSATTPPAQVLLHGRAGQTLAMSPLSTSPLPLDRDSHRSPRLSQPPLPPPPPPETHGPPPPGLPSPAAPRKRSRKSMRLSSESPPPPPPPPPETHGPGPQGPLSSAAPGRRFGSSVRYRGLNEGVRYRGLTEDVPYSGLTGEPTAERNRTGVRSGEPADTEALPTTPSRFGQVRVIEVGACEMEPASHPPGSSSSDPAANLLREATVAGGGRTRRARSSRSRSSAPLPSAASTSLVPPNENNVSASELTSIHETPSNHDQPAERIADLQADDARWAQFLDIDSARFEMDAPPGASPDNNSLFVDSMTQHEFAAAEFVEADAFVPYNCPNTPRIDARMPVTSNERQVEVTETRPEGALEGSDSVRLKKRIVCTEHSQQDTTHHAEQDNGDGDGRRKKAKMFSPDSTVGGGNGNHKFACPYFKRNPNKYRKWTSCPGPGWEEVHRVKTHLYRRHQLPIQCPRCWTVFKADGQLQLHLQQDPPCTVQANRMLHEGFTKDQEKRLRSRKKTNADMTDEDKWREIYTVLFPDDDESAIPSPYYSDSDSDGDGRGAQGSGELEDYATFIRREMPTLVRRELEGLFRDEFRDVEERVRPRIAEIVLNLQPRLLNLYKQSQMPLSEYGPQQPGEAGDGSEPTLTPLLSHGTNSGTVTSADSTPSTVFGANSFFSVAEPHAAQFLPDSSLNANWGTVYSGHQAQPQVDHTGVGLGLNWDLEFDRLLNPVVFMPPSLYSSHVPATLHPGP